MAVLSICLADTPVSHEVLDDLGYTAMNGEHK